MQSSSVQNNQESLPDNAGSITQVAKGQKTVIYAVMLNILGVVLVTAAPSMGLSEDAIGIMAIVSIVLRLAALGMGIYGITQVGAGLGWSVVTRILIVVLLFLPLINIITLLVVNGKATSALKRAGYKVGLAGAYK